MVCFIKIVMLLGQLLAIILKTPRDPELIISERHVLRFVPGASGLEYAGDHLYVIGDNSPWLYRLDTQFRPVDSLPINFRAHQTNGPIPKADKPDFEALAIDSGNNGLFIFGSGSQSQERDTLVQIQFNQDQLQVRSISLHRQYQALQNHPVIRREGLNIEGAVIKDEFLYLLNRGGNLLLRYNLDKFLRAEDEQPESYEFQLPSIQGIEAGFSGATLVPGEDLVIFTASVENTANWIEDGAVLGSFVGILDLRQPGEYIRPACVLLTEDQKPAKVKVESVAIHTIRSSGLFDLLLVTDSDGGNSLLIEASLQLQ